MVSLLLMLLMMGPKMLKRRQSLVLRLRLLRVGIRNEEDGSIMGSTLEHGARLGSYLACLVRSGGGGRLALGGCRPAGSGQVMVVFRGTEARQAVPGNIGGRVPLFMA